MDKAAQPVSLRPHFRMGLPGGETPSLIEAPIHDRLLNLFSTSQLCSSSGWASPGGETLSDRGPHHGQAAQPVLYVSNSVSISGWASPVVKPSNEALSWTGCSTCSLRSQLCLHFRMAYPVVKPSLIEAPIMDRLLNLFSTVSNYVSISGWASPGW
ncbi:hypothetical protein DPMN_147131 [Dreissena polymorpha]|uniref:Uncharacterized protein n=1 Tax=Dreissena polymorpha TaxID=45954 RepID=A0A9D4F8F7_DREPO|nr:hypothetical protein DPMN_147131 [Dreissena polymorpha]